jgi:hypothetical protein
LGRGAEQIILDQVPEHVDAKSVHARRSRNRITS